MNTNSSKSTTMLSEAIALASFLHKDQRDKSGRPYILHPLSVMFKCSPIDTIMTVAILHDVIEDCEITIKNLEELNFPDDVRESVQAMTRGVFNDKTGELEFRMAKPGEKKEIYTDFIKRVAKNPISCIVKMKDIEDNTDPKRMQKLDHNENARIIERYRKAQAVLYQPYVEACLKYYEEII